MHCNTNKNYTPLDLYEISEYVDDNFMLAHDRFNGILQQACSLRKFIVIMTKINHVKIATKVATTLQ